METERTRAVADVITSAVSGWQRGQIGWCEVFDVASYFLSPAQLHALAPVTRRTPILEVSALVRDALSGWTPVTAVTLTAVAELLGQPEGEQT